MGFVVNIGNQQVESKIRQIRQARKKGPNTWFLVRDGFFMAVQFILGRSGTGKTTRCISAIVKALTQEESGHLLLLVPEQATYQAERAILANKAIGGYHRLHVLSFDRLGFLLSGKNTARPALSKLGRQMMIHKLLRDSGDRLKVFAQSATSTGLGLQMAETISELHKYAKTPEDVDSLLKQLAENQHSGITAEKFADIGLVFEKYLDAIEGKFIDPDIQVSNLCKTIAESEIIKGAKLWVDGFAGFTAAELAVLTELLKTVQDAQIALCLGPLVLDLSGHTIPEEHTVRLFNPTEQTYTDLLEGIKKCNLKLSEPIVLDKPMRFQAAAALAHIEQNIFEVKPTESSTTQGVRIVSAPNARAEVQFIADQILELVGEKGCRYRDIAVIASDIDRYQHYIRAYFENHRIPFFIDMRKPLNQHPVVDLICSAISVVTGGFNSSDIFSYLKTDLVPIPRYSVDLLENYCLAFGVDPGDWQGDRPWRFSDKEDHVFDEQQINQIRKEVCAPLLKLYKCFYDDDNSAKQIIPGDFTKAVFDLLDDLKVRERLTQWIAEAGQADDYATMDEHRQFHDKLVDIFDELVEVFQGQEQTAEDYLAILDSAFSQLAMAFIPPRLDQVLVGTIERSRHPDLKAVFLIGTTQRQFPTPINTSGILTDDDRNIAAQADFELAATTTQKLIERQYLAYIAFTRPSHHLFVTYPLADDKGSPEVRSQFVGELEALFENLQEESITMADGDIDHVHNEYELADLLCAGLGKDRPGDTEQTSTAKLEALLDAVSSDSQLSNVGSNVVSAIEYDNIAQLNADVVEKLYSRRLGSSATRLATFAACPYRYFARYILKLEPRREFRFEPLDMGLFYHRVLDGLLKELVAHDTDFATAEDDLLMQLLREQIQRLITADPFISSFAAHSPHNTFIISSAGETLADCVRAISRMSRAGSFRARHSEVSFGQVNDSVEDLGQYEIALANGRTLSMSGKIDRLDIAQIDGEKIAVVFDYKRTPTSFNWSKFYYGLDMQLPIYMLALRNCAAIQEKIVGAFYMPVDVTAKKASLEDIEEAAEKPNYKAKGIFDGRYTEQLDKSASKNSEFYNFYVTKDGQPYGSYGNRGVLKAADFESVLQFAGKKIVQLAQEILHGTIDVHPYRLGTESPCQWCDYRSVCRFDWQVNNYNSLATLSKPAVLEAIGAGDG